MAEKLHKNPSAKSGTQLDKTTVCMAVLWNIIWGSKFKSWTIVLPFDHTAIRISSNNSPDSSAIQKQTEQSI